MPEVGGPRIPLWVSVSTAMEWAHAEALDEVRKRQVLAWLETRGVGRTPTPGTVARGVEADHTEALAYDDYRTNIRAELDKFAAGEAPYPYVRVNEGEQETRVVDIELAHVEARSEDVARFVAGRRGRFCRKGQHPCTPAVTLAFDGGSRRLHWCAEHAADADRYREPFYTPAAGDAGELYGDTTNA